jgi:hypothetical protein
MDLFDTLTWAEILGKTTFLGTLTLTGAFYKENEKKKLSIFRKLAASRDPLTPWPGPAYTLVQSRNKHFVHN